MWRKHLSTADRIKVDKRNHELGLWLLDSLPKATMKEVLQTVCREVGSLVFMHNLPTSYMRFGEWALCLHRLSFRVVAAGHFGDFRDPAEPGEAQGGGEDRAAHGALHLAGLRVRVPAPPVIRYAMNRSARPPESVADVTGNLRRLRSDLAPPCCGLTRGITCTDYIL